MKYPKTHSFEHVNAFVHDVDVEFEELQAACLGLSTELEKYERLVKKCVASDTKNLFLLQTELRPQRQIESQIFDAIDDTQMTNNTPNEALAEKRDLKAEITKILQGYANKS